MNLKSDIKYIKGIGQKRAALFSKLGINTVEDFITFFPRNYQDRRKITHIKNIIVNEHYCIYAQVKNVYEQHISANMSLFTVELNDSTDTIFAKIFRKSNPYSKIDIFKGLRDVFKTNNTVYIYGEVSVKFGQKQITVEDYELVTEGTKPSKFNKIIPIYNLTDGINNKFISSVIKDTVTLYAEQYPDIISVFCKGKNNFLSIQNAIKLLHFPNSFEDAELSRQTFALQEFILMQIILIRARKEHKIKTKIQKYEIKKTLLTPFKQKLSFDFTNAQKKAINEIFNDMLAKKQMKRMLMGDVGSGKTIVALSAILLAVENGYQAAIVAPTEILAEQHFLTFSNILNGMNINIELLTSSVLKNKNKREETLKNILNGTVNIVVGTHSVMEERVKFKNLSFIVVDEQHRFGVMQKVSALSKGTSADILMMTATPIPRGLAMTIYGEMAISTINELPPNRMPIETLCLNEDVAYSRALYEIQNGGQVYIVFPLVDESDKIELKSAICEAERLSNSVFKNFKVGLLHGKMKPKEKNEIMLKFKNKEFNILISTTVIEVGIDVPNATTIIIQHADRYGLATLHQLRGRVGRGTKKSYCYLVSDSKSSNSKKRLSIMVQTTDGFKIAAEDLKMRGPGEFLGTMQHGFPEFKAGDIIKDLNIIEQAKKYAENIITEDPLLKLEKNKQLKELISAKYSNISQTIKVG